jgi:hypothetical protein
MDGGVIAPFPMAVDCGLASQFIGSKNAYYFELGLDPAAPQKSPVSGSKNWLPKTEYEEPQGDE